jgi:hypothetical protein
MDAYILITTTVGRAGTLAREIGSIDGIASAETVTGAYDVVARVRVGSLAELHDRVMASIADAGGVTRILPCTVLRTEPAVEAGADWEDEAAAAS